MSTLARFLVETSTSQAALAQRLGCSRSYLSEIVNGQKTPGLELALRIERETGGKVPVSSYFSPSAPSSRRAS